MHCLIFPLFLTCINIHLLSLTWKSKDQVLPVGEKMSTFSRWHAFQKLSLHPIQGHYPKPEGGRNFHYHSRNDKTTGIFSFPQKVWKDRLKIVFYFFEHCCKYKCIVQNLAFLFLELCFDLYWKTDTLSWRV